MQESDDFVGFVEKISYYAKQYSLIQDLVSKRDTKEYLYLIVNADFGFTLQPALLMSAIAYQDTEAVVKEKIKIVSKFLTRQLSWRVWNQNMISQSSMEASIYELAVKLREKPLSEIKPILEKTKIISNTRNLNNAPTLNQQNRPKIRVLLALITEIVSKNCDNPDYLLNKSDKKDPIEVEHIWSDHFDDHTDEFSDSVLFANARNNIGDLLLAPKSFNSAWGDKEYNIKVEKYYGQNALAQQISERADLYKKILEYEFGSTHIVF